MENREEKIDIFINTARKYIGTKFKHQGRDNNGMDCIGIIVVPLKEIGFFTYDTTNYRRYGLGGEIIEVITKYCKEIKKPFKLQRGDILLFSDGPSQHLAIYTGKSIIHANSLVRKVVEQDLDEEQFNKISKVFRYMEDMK